MKLEDIVNTISNIHSGGLSETERSIAISKFIDDFHEKSYKIIHEKSYKIVPKEQWCVTMTLDGNINATAGQGPFESKEIAEKFADIWNRMREDEIDQIITNEPDKEHSFLYIKAKAIPLSISEKNLGIMKEIEDED